MNQEAEKLRQKRVVVRRRRFWDDPFKNTWRYAANTFLFAVLTFGFIYIVNSYSERSGSIIQIVEGPKSPLFVDHKYNGLPLMRLPLGAPLSYDLTWYYLEGGCDAALTLEFAQSFDSHSNTGKKEPRVRIVQDIPGRNLAVGAPGQDHIERPQPLGLRPGLWHYTSTMNAVCANGRKPPPEKVVDFYVDIFDPHHPAVALDAPVNLVTSSVPLSGSIHYTVSYTRYVEAPTTVFYTLVSKDAGRSKVGESDVIIVQRPSVFSKAGTYKNTDVVFDLPPEIRVGEWTLQVTTVTNLPDGRTQTDHLFDVQFEVVS